MIYICSPVRGKTVRFDIESMLDGPVDFEKILRSRRFSAMNQTNTRTYTYDSIPLWAARIRDLEILISSLEDFNKSNKYLIMEENKRNLYTFYKIPKHSGGFRKISAPCDDLMIALRNLKDIFETVFKPLYHTSAFAFVKGRSTVDAVRRHQQNGSWWFLKTDFSKFFDNATEEFVWNQLSQVFPFSEVVKVERGRKALREALSLCFLDGGLPQGSPVSPFLTNVMMIPIDYRLANDLRNNNGRCPRFGDNHFVYTRYVDDINISCKGTFDWRDVMAYMQEVLNEFGAPFGFNEKKTHYGSRNGRNWMLGVMLNKDNEITIGHKKKHDYRATIHSFVMSRQDDGVYDGWTPEDINHLIGITSYYNMVEPDFISSLRNKISAKYGRDYVDDMNHATAGSVSGEYEYGLY